MCFCTVCYVYYGLIKMEQTVKICYKTSFPFGRCTNCMFKNLSTNKTKTVLNFPAVQFDSFILDIESQFFELYIRSNFSKTAQCFGILIRFHPHMNKKGNTYRV